MAQMSVQNERFIEEIVASGRFASRQDAIDEAICLLRNEVQSNGSPRQIRYSVRVV